MDMVDTAGLCEKAFSNEPHLLLSGLHNPQATQADLRFGSKSALPEAIRVAARHLARRPQQSADLKSGCNQPLTYLKAAATAFETPAFKRASEPKSKLHSGKALKPKPKAANAPSSTLSRLV